MMASLWIEGRGVISIELPKRADVGYGEFIWMVYGFVQDA
jgi:hypothetical protein